MARGLSTAELKSIRDTLATGRRPKVMFTESAGQIAGQVGQVTKLTDPGLSDEWVVVRFGHDELPFSPNDLTVPARAPKAPSGKREATTRAAVGPDAAKAGDGVDQAGPGGATDTGTAAPAGVSAADTTAAPGSVDAEPPADPAGHRPDPAQPGEGTRESADVATGSPAPRPRKAAGAARTAKSKPLPGLTVTIAYSEGEWTVAANQGTKALAKPYVIKASEALRMVALLDVPGVHEAVEQIVSAERAEAEAEAERLRGQLAQLEERLAELRDAGTL